VPTEELDVTNLNRTQAADRTGHPRTSVGLPVRLRTVPLVDVDAPSAVASG